MEIKISNQTPFGPTSWAIVRAIREGADRLLAEIDNTPHEWNDRQLIRTVRVMRETADEMQIQLEEYANDPS